MNQINTSSLYKYKPNDEANTKPNPMANGPPIFRNFSLGAQTATSERLEMTPAVIKAALMIKGPPTKDIGAITAPNKELWANQANCLDPNPGEYGILAEILPRPIKAAIVIPKAFQEIENKHKLVAKDELKDSKLKS